ncbi:FAD-binding oxidoreductase [Gordonia sp. HY002]|uniref:globin domain-containing protein n=1 Tax=Gordonia zhenghanii TaxID=2911516 RepID=UPI001EF0411C|nr:globin domain-containing protein [Gordonia zhenghanii]MCF8570993.1 FAD-binding oxidoreductase [Gordonia zhenghanii]MCF8607473.1 FAD-binding oxidoreductase [Gordonia zhenghanii]
MNSPAQPVLSDLRRLIAADPDRFAASVFTRLFSASPPLRDLFPVSMAPLRATFTQFVDYVLEAISAEDGHEDLIEFLAQLGRDHRKYGVTSEHYWLMYDALMTEFSRMLGPRWTQTAFDAASHAMMLMTGVMRGAAESASEPSVWQARVVQKFTINRERAVVRLVAEDGAPRYHAGQYTEVQIPQWPHVWRNLSPAIPPNPRGELEFHVHSIPTGQMSGTIVRETEPGDVWTFGQMHGTMRVTDDRPVLMVAGGSGLAPLRAILLDMAQRVDNPQTHLFYGSRHPGELYELGVLQQLARTNPWLHVTAVSETESDPWWIDGAPDPRQWGFDLRFGRVGEVAVDYPDTYSRHSLEPRDWTDHQILLSGPAPMVFHTQLKLRAAGVDPANISHDPLN